MTSFRERERELQRKNNDLQHMLLDLEAKIESMKEQTRSSAEAVRASVPSTTSAHWFSRKNVGSSVSRLVNKMKHVCKFDVHLCAAGL